MRRKGRHINKRRLRHDHWGQFKNALRNHFREELVPMWEDKGFCAMMEEALNRKPDGILEAERNAGPRPATDNEPPKA